LNKEEMISALAQRTGMTKVNARVALDAVFQIITDTLSAGEKIKLTELGVFEARERAPRVGRNPKANVPVPIPAKRVPFFKPSEGLKAAVERGE
jgi:DNA-binding protein HU-beta